MAPVAVTGSEHPGSALRQLGARGLWRWLAQARTGGLLALASVIALLPLLLSNNYFYEIAILVALKAIVCVGLNLIESPPGRALRALHGSEIAAETLGIDSARYKLRVFVISAVFAAVAGALTAHYAGFITPAKASFMHSVELVIMVVFGGMASIFGAVVGAVILTTLPQLLTVLKDYEMIVFGAVVIATMVFFPHGVVPTLQRWLGRAGK